MIVDQQPSKDGLRLHRYYGASGGAEANVLDLVAKTIRQI